MSTSLSDGFSKHNQTDPVSLSAAHTSNDEDGPNNCHWKYGTMDDTNSPEIIRMACLLCRRRKLKCNRQTPRCDSCIKLQQECVYGVVRVKKSTRKDRTKTLEGRLGKFELILFMWSAGWWWAAQIEKLLRIQDNKNSPINNGGSQPSPASQSPNEESAAEVEEETIRELFVYHVPSAVMSRSN